MAQGLLQTTQGDLVAARLDKAVSDVGLEVRTRREFGDTLVEEGLGFLELARIQQPLGLVLFQLCQVLLGVLGDQVLHLLEQLVDGVKQCLLHTRGKLDHQGRNLTQAEVGVD